MTDTVIRLRGRLPKDAAIHRSAEKLYAEGRGHAGYALVRWHVDLLEDSDAGDSVRIAIDQIEVADGEAADTVRQLIAEISTARGGDPELPYDKATMERLAGILRAHQETQSWTDEQLTSDWIDYFGPADDEHTPPPLLGAPELALREYLLARGAIAELDTDVTDSTDTPGLLTTDDDSTD